MIKRPNKVFFLSNEMNFIPREFSLDNYKESLINAMTTGFGPYPIVSVKVANKVATVDIGEKARLYGGVKISIDGTGVTDIDTWHEIDTVEGNTFTFKVDVPDGEYTNGITLSYPSLGWTLADRDANNFLFRSGSSGSSAHYVRLAFNRDRPNWAASENWRNTLIVEKVECDGTLTSIRMVTPKDYNVGIYLVIELAAPSNYNWQWYVYGDDTYAILGHKGYWRGGTLYSKRANFWQCSFGEIRNSAYKAGTFIINGLVNPNYFWSSAAVPPSGHQATDVGYGGYLAGGNWNFDASFVLVGRGNEYNCYTDQFGIASSVPLFASDVRSGFNFDKNVTKYINNNMYGRFVVYNRDYASIGEVPGVHPCIHMPSMVPAFTYIAPHNGVDVLESFLKPVYPTGQLEGRKVYAFYSGGYNTFQPGTNNPNNIYPTWQSSILLDLTGPIR